MDDIFDNWTIQVHKGVVELCLLSALAEGGALWVCIGVAPWCHARTPGGGRVHISAAFQNEDRWSYGHALRGIANRPGSDRADPAELQAELKEPAP